MHSIYGVATTLNASNFLFYLSLVKVLQLEHPDAVKVYTDEALDFLRGLGTEIYWRDNVTCPTESEYKEITTQKGGFLTLAIRLMQLFSENKEDFTKLSAILNHYLQIHDDYCDVTNNDCSESKSFCGDLSAGKFSFPIIHAVRKEKNDHEVLRKQFIYSIFILSCHCLMIHFSFLSL